MQHEKAGNHKKNDKTMRTAKFKIYSLYRKRIKSMEQNQIFKPQYL